MTDQDEHRTMVVAIRVAPGRGLPMQVRTAAVAETAWVSWGTAMCVSRQIAYDDGGERE